MFFFFNDTATTEIYTLSLHDALPIYPYERKCSYEKTTTTAHGDGRNTPYLRGGRLDRVALRKVAEEHGRSEEHTSELQSRQYLVCRLLLEKKKKIISISIKIKQRHPI